MEITVYEQAPACRWLTLSFLVTEKKTYPWIGTTGAGQNCPEGESESPGEDMIFEDRGSVLTFFSRSLPDHLW